MVVVITMQIQIAALNETNEADDVKLTSQLTHWKNGMKIDGNQESLQKTEQTK